MAGNIKTSEKPFSYSRYTWQRFRRRKSALVSLYLLVFMVIIGLLADILATSQPWYARYRGKSFYPAFQVLFNSHKRDSTLNPATAKYEYLVFSRTDWYQLPLEKVVWAPVPYSPAYADPLNRGYVSPNEEQKCYTAGGAITTAKGRMRHHMGTNSIGLDVLSGLIHGTRIALEVGIVSAGIAALIGIFMGALAGYYGDNRMKMPRGKMILLLLGVALGFFYAFIYRSYTIQSASEEGLAAMGLEILISFLVFGLWLLSAVLLGRYMKNLPWLGKPIHAPVDQLVMRTVEVIDSLPLFIVVITIASLFRERSLMLLMAIIGLTSWTSIARFTRAEFLRNRSLEYTEAARAMGYRDARIIFRHILPNTLMPVFINVAFAIAGAIQLESALSFLGVGVPPGTITWGSLLSAGRDHIDAWWIILYPGLAIFITVTMYNLIGEGLREALDPRDRG